MTAAIYLDGWTAFGFVVGYALFVAIAVAVCLKVLR